MTASLEANLNLGSCRYDSVKRQQTKRNFIFQFGWKMFSEKNPYNPYPRLDVALKYVKCIFKDDLG